MHKPSRVEVAGPLAAFAVGFRRELAGRGYSRSRTTGLLLLMARLSRWLADRGREAGEMSDVDLEQFVSHRRVVSRDDRQLTARAMTPLLEHLRGLGVVPRPVPVVALTPREQLLTGRRLRAVFTRLVDQAGLAPRNGSRRPRVHDLRHAFAVRTLLDWYRDGGDVAARMPLLSAYLGHAHPSSTYWYLQAVPEPLTPAAERLESSSDVGPA